MDTQRIEDTVTKAVADAFCRDRAFAQQVQNEVVRQLVATVRASTLPSLDFTAGLETAVAAEITRQKSLIRETSDRMIAAAWSSRAGKLAETIEHHIRASIRDALANAIQRKLVVKDGTIRIEETT